MRSDFAVTFYFKDIFPNFAHFANFLTRFTNISNDDAINVYFYKYLYNKYCNSNINYDTEDAFLRHFGITYQDNFNRYKKIKDIIDAEYGLTIDDLTTFNKSISNLSDNNNEILNDPLSDIAKFITSQNTSITTNNKLMAYIAGIDELTDYYLLHFLDEFDRHFMQIYVNQKYEF